MSEPPLSLTRFSAPNHIGGTQLVLTCSDTNLLLDFGLDFAITKMYLHEYVHLRSYSHLTDNLQLHLVPAPTFPELQTLYRPELISDRFRGMFPEYQEDGDPAISHVLLTHAHLDHCGMIQFLHARIGLICGTTTHAMLEISQKIYRTSHSLANVLGLWQGSRRNIAFHPRELTIASPDPQNVSENVAVQFYPTDHSLPGSGAFVIHDRATQKKVVYTGDIRWHGLHTELVDQLVQDLGEAEVDLLICEGTHLGEENETDYFTSEQDAHDAIGNRIDEISTQHPESLVLFQCSEKNCERILGFARAAQAVDRILVLTAKSYLYFKGLIDRNLIPNAEVDWDRVQVFLPKMASGTYAPADYSYNNDLHHVMRKSEAECAQAKRKYEMINVESPIMVRIETIEADPGNYVVEWNYFKMPHLLDLFPLHDAYYIFSESEVEDPEAKIQLEKEMNWLALAEIPADHIVRLHCSGHMLVPDLERFINAIAPRHLLILHSEHPEAITDLNLSSDIQIVEANPFRF